MEMLTAEQLLAGSSLRHEVEIPSAVMKGNGRTATETRIVLRPLTVNDLQRIGKAAQDDNGLSASLMIRHALVEPELKLEQVAQLPAGLARFLVEQINHISGIDTPTDSLTKLVQAPLARACFVLAKEFGWTPEEVSGMTIGQILMYLEMTRQEGTPA
ncbi:MAG: hypothetical protein KC449_00110 [Anaerolineales bacterium]|nr:hypothetical protein [Anaerolineales bacterium]